MVRKLIVLVVFLTACVDKEARQGGEGEFCNGRDTDCRPGLLCVDGICEAGFTLANDCETICEKISGCGGQLSGCVYSCNLTIEDWAVRAQQDFGQCVVEDLACAEIEQAFAPQTCYERILIPEDRAETCAALREALDSCGLPDFEGEFSKVCQRSARVDREEKWQETADCAENRTCDTLEQCLGF